MPKKSINFYGYDRETYENCGDLIRNMNRRHMEFLNVWFLLLNAMFILFSLFGIFGVDKRSLRLYITYFSVAAVFEILIRALPRFVLRTSRLMVFINVVILVSYGVAASAAQPYMAAVMFHVIIVLIGISFVDMLATMAGALLISCGVFLFSSFLKKMDLRIE